MSYREGLLAAAEHLKTTARDYQQMADQERAAARKALTSIDKHQHLLKAQAYEDKRALLDGQAKQVADL